MRGSSLVVVAGLLLAFPAAGAEDRETRERAARKACLTGDAAKGVEILADLYIDTRNPVHIYNQGRCFEQSNRHDEAIARFREYLRKATNLTVEERLDAEKHIADCEALLARTNAAQGTAPAAGPAPAAAVANQPQPPPAKAAPSEPVVSTTQVPSAERSPAGGGLRTAGIATAATGTAALIAAVVLNLKVNNTIDDLHQHYDEDTESSGKTYKALSQVGYGVGAALVAGGAVLYYLGLRARDRADVALLPSLAPGLAGVSLEGAF